MQGFIKSTNKNYSGFEKAAVLLCELGNAREGVLNALALSSLEKSKLLRAIEKLGHYNPNNMDHVKREQAVLSEVLLYGSKKNILSTKPVVPAKQRDKNKDMWQTVKKDPDRVAEVLKVWLSDKDEEK